MKKMKEIVSKRLSIYRRRDVELLGQIGNLASGEIEVSGAEHTVYVTLQTTGQVVEVINRAVPNLLGDPVVVGYVQDAPTVLQVLRVWRAYGSAESAGDGLPNHGTQHSYPNFDMSYIWGEQFVPSLPVPALLTLNIYPGRYRIGAGWKDIRGITTVDLASYVPVTAGKAKIVLVVVNAAGAFAVRDGSEITGYDNLDEGDYPATVAGDAVICGVKLFTGQAEIRHAPAADDIIDLRFAGANSAATAGITSLTGDVTATGPGAAAATIANGAVTSPKLAVLEYVDFDTTPASTVQEGRLQWNDTDGTLDIGLAGGVTMQTGQELFTKVRNNSGATITDGSVVYISGRTGVFPDVSLARADAEATSRVLGVVTQTMLSPSFGFVTTLGYVRGIKTDYTGAGIWGTTWVTGDLLYVSETTAGQITNVKPAVPHHSDIVGTVGIVSATQGSILVTLDRHLTLGELADVTEVGAAANYPLLFNGSHWLPAGFGLTGTAAQTYAFPAAGGTVALLNAANSFSLTDTGTVAPGNSFAFFSSNATGTRSSATGVIGYIFHNAAGSAATLAATYGAAIQSAGNVTRLEAVAGAAYLQAGIAQSVSSIVGVSLPTGGTADYVAVLRSEGVQNDGAAITAAYGLKIDPNINTSGTIGTNYGIKVDDQNIAAIPNYALKTGLGSVELGDVLTISTPAVNGYYFRIQDGSGSNGDRLRVKNAAAGSGIVFDSTNYNEGAYAPMRFNASAVFYEIGNVNVGSGTDGAARLNAYGKDSGITAIFQSSATTPGDAWQVRTALEAVVASADPSGRLTTAGRRQAVVIKAVNYTLTTNDEVVTFTATATATLPAATGTGQTYRIICRAGTLTIDGNGTDTIKGDLTQALYPGEDLIITDTAAGIWE